MNTYSILHHKALIIVLTRNIPLKQVKQNYKNILNVTNK